MSVPATLTGSQRMCLAFIILGSVVCLAGYVSPYWEYGSHNEASIEVEIGIGLIFGCYKLTITMPTSTTTDAKCEVVDWDMKNQDMDYFKAVRVLMAVSLLCLLCSTAIGLTLCCNCKLFSNIGYASVLSILGGLVGVAGVATFAVCTKGDAAKSMVEILLTDLSKGWAFYLSAAGSSFLLVMGLLSLVAPKRRTMYLFTPTNENYSFSNSGYGKF